MVSPPTHVCAAPAGRLSRSTIAPELKLSAYTSAVYPSLALSELSKRAASAYFSHKLFKNPWVKQGVRLIRRLLP